ncbi:MAG: hypothetical protein H7249_01555 [Chitinophagaceae bacterium]|nr:hypothetical protein [Oligoflexus sp.]
MRRYIATGIMILAMNTACEEKKKPVVIPVDRSKDIVLANPVEISLPTVSTDVREKAAPIEKPMTLSAKALPVEAKAAPVSTPVVATPAPVRYEDVTSTVLAEGSRNEVMDEGIAKIKEKALLRLKELQSDEDATESEADKAPTRDDEKVAVAEPQAAESTKPAEESAPDAKAMPSIDLPAKDEEPLAAVKTKQVDSKTAKALEIRFNKARNLAKVGKVEAAKSLFLDICQAGHAHACHKFAWYEELAGNTANATRFYRAACDNGLGKSCNNLAFQFEQKKNYDKALDLYAKGCMDKHEASCTSLKRIREGQLLNQKEKQSESPQAR